MTDKRKIKDKKSADSASSRSENGSGSNGKGPPPPPTVKLGRGLMSWVMILALLIMLFVLLNNTKGRGHEIPTWQEFTKYVEGGAVLDDSIIIRDDRIMANVVPNAAGFPPSTEPTAIWVRIDASNREWFLNQLETAGAPFHLDTGTSVWVSLLRWHRSSCSSCSSGSSWPGRCGPRARAPAGCSAASENRGTASPTRRASPSRSVTSRVLTKPRKRWRKSSSS
jgi:hypothetical protein